MLNHNDVATSIVGLPPEYVVFGRSPAMQSMRDKIRKLAATNVPLLIQGDHGTGKEVLARLVHAHSVWSNGPFVKVNCAAIPGTLIESELFGYQQGAFTGAYASKPGRVEAAQDGTLFFDGISELDLGVQAKLLQFLQDGRFYRIGDHEERHVETRIICATNRQLEEEIAAGKFRLDFFYRINVFHFKLPRLCDRRADIPSLVDYFISNFAARFGRPIPPLPEKIMRILQKRDWPGNIRELENCIARCVILGADDALEEYIKARPPFPLPLEMGNDTSTPLRNIADKLRRELERDVILQTLETHNWNRRRTAEALKISYRTLLYKVREAGIPSIRQR